jgi:hypothetical protein
MGHILDVAGQVLRFEQRLEAYQKLHAEELTELWQVLNECKRAIVALCDERANGSDAVNAAHTEREVQGQTTKGGEERETIT